MESTQTSGDLRLEQKQIVTLFALLLLPTVLSYTSMVVSLPRDNALDRGSILIFVNLACVVTPIILPLLWSRGLCYANIKQRVKDRSFNRYLYIAFVPVFCFLAASFLEYKTGLLNHEIFFVSGQGRWVDARAWIIDLLVTIRFMVVLLAIGSMEDAKWRRAAMATSYFAPLVVQDFFAQLLYLRYKGIDAPIVKLFLPHFASWIGWATAITGFFTVLTLVEVFRPSLKIALVWLVLTTISQYVFSTPHQWYYVGYLAFSLIFVLTAWQLRAFGRQSVVEDLTLSEQDSASPLQT